MLYGLRSLRPLAIRTRFPGRGFSSSIVSRSVQLDPVTSNYVKEMFNSWKSDPFSVHQTWDTYFRNNAPPAENIESLATSADVGALTQKILTAYRKYGHFHAQLDPLGLKKRPLRKELESLFSEEDISKVVRLTDIDTKGDRPNLEEGYTIGDLVANLEVSYCGSVGVEYMHIQDRAQCNWIRARVENQLFTKSTEDNIYIPKKEDRMNCLDRLIWATSFEEFLQNKFQDKRFGADGGEVIIPGVKTLIDSAADFGVEDIVIGMAHRGRLNMLANVVRKPTEGIFHEFQKGTETKEHFASGDVKYHLGVSFDRPTRSGKRVHLTLVPNPSHLEAVNPVVEGKARAKQFQKDDKDRSKVMSVLIHGDGSFAGQGVVYETITMSSLPKYTTGGTIHVIINNQISFTTDPQDECPTEYCTAVSLTNGAPVFHVNGDDPDAVCWVFKLAAEWRQTFHKDIVVDIVCYRRYGHNEVDQPAFTQPLMYKAIAKHPKTVDIYSKRLVDQGLLSNEEFGNMKKTVWDLLEGYFQQSLTYDYQFFNKAFEHLQSTPTCCQTGIEEATYDKVAKALVTLPDKFKLHPTLEKQLAAKKKMLESGDDLDWGTAEALAFGSLLVEGAEVRLSGQDAERGTFAHRNAVLHEQITGEEYTPLSNIPGVTSSFQVKNSFLSEYAALGYEFGYSIESLTKALVIWEAQFGDFANGAQIMIDQFISCCEQKWMCHSSLVLLLPHGMDGMGPEHSSARLERFLQMYDQDDREFLPDDATSLRACNIIVANATTPANIFHLLRRQVYSQVKKPLVVMSPKNLLRHPLVKSPKSDFIFSTEAGFQRTISETSTTLDADDKIQRLIFCSGKLYYELFEKREKDKLTNVAIVRVEQLAPFPFDLVAKDIQKYPNAEVVWVQEEHKNHGAWVFMYFHFKTALKHINRSQKELKYIGRGVSASPATGQAKQHVKEQTQLLKDAFAF